VTGPVAGPAWRRLGSEDVGSAVVEFCALGLLMLVPLVYLVLALARIEQGALAVQRAARESGRVYVTARDDAQGRARAVAAARLALSDQGFDDAAHDERSSLDLGCGGRDCLAADARVTTRVSLAVVLPGVPRFLDGVIPVRVQVTASQVTAVDRFRPRAATAGSP
jgi:hypothetical protein